MIESLETRPTRISTSYRTPPGPAPERNPRHLNNSCDAEMGRGDYAAALALCRAAAEILVAERAPADPERMAVESNLARATALAGEPARALQQFEALIARAEANSGADSFPVALNAFRATRAALLAGRIDRARALAERAHAIVVASFASPHPWRARTLRMRGLVALAQDDRVAAEAERRAASAEADAVFTDGHPLRAQLALDRAELALRNGERDAARDALAEALPGLRTCCREAELDRAHGERLATALGLDRGE
jgi:tetratricopeptide (TPR) repeat protein